VVSFTATSGDQALAVLEERADSVRIVISDYAMAGMNGADLLCAVRLRWPHIARVLLTGNADLPAAARAVNQGQVARLFVKPWQPDELLDAVISVLEEGRLLRENQYLQALASGEAPGRPLGSAQLTRSTDTSARPLAATEQLSAREHEVLELLVTGLTNREIGSKLYLSPATVKAHVGHIIAKLGVSDRTQAAVRAIELQLVSSGRSYVTPGS
jgi:DNA-binding NarL/FixJ family response regulator